MHIYKLLYIVYLYILPAALEELVAAIEGKSFGNDPYIIYIRPIYCKGRKAANATGEK